MEGFIMNEKYRTEFLTMVNEFIQKYITQIDYCLMTISKKYDYANKEMITRLSLLESKIT